jgi:hypothetical protein
MHEVVPQVTPPPPAPHNGVPPGTLQDRGRNKRGKLRGARLSAATGLALAGCWDGLDRLWGSVEGIFHAVFLRPGIRPSFFFLWYA